MLKIVQARCLLLLAACAVSASGCGKSAEEKEPATPLTDTSGLLRYVPENTPYVFATLAPLPDAFVDKIEPKLDRLLAAYSQLIGVAFAEAQAHEKVEEAEAKRLDALVAELQSLMSVEGLANAGMTRESTLVLYGHGLLPVMRVTLTDATLFDDAMTRIEASAGEQLPVAEVDGTPYRYVEDENVRVIIATVGDEFVLTVAPAGLDDAALAGLLGLKLPARNIAQTRKLLDIAREYGYMHEYIGVVDTVRVAETFIEEPKGVDAVLLAMAGYDVGSLSDDCKTEFRALAETAPRIVTGYEEISADKLRTNAVIELRQDIASEIGTFVSPVPGLGTIYEGLFSFGMSLDIEAIRSFFDKRVAALQKEPWKCEHLLDAQDHLIAMREQALAQPVPPILYDFHGFLAVVNELDGLDLAKKQPPDSIDASFLLAIDNAQGLLAMGQAMLPQLAEMNIEADGKAHRFELPETSAEAETAWVALSESAIALSVSEDAETALPTLLKAEAGVPPPFISVGIDGARYYSLVGEAMRASDDEEMSEEMREALSDALAVAEDFYERLQFDVTFTARGIEIDSEANLAD
ncbi:MAG: hypothetical protein AMJ68_00205 [Acidithiobacillales bacterium SG8_45]|nr:MAG: hypothetical protein AMJ68_00205 [Acidithiobacillales bacterium SG8_45]